MIDRFLPGLDGKMEDPVDFTCMTVSMPGDLDPLERHGRFAIHLDAELRLAGLGCCSGGGTLYTHVDFDADDPTEGADAATILDIDATDVERARVLLRLHLPELGAPAGTLVQYGPHEDRFDGEGWQLHEPRGDLQQE